MQPQQIDKYITLAVAEIRNERLCLIEDIFKVKKMMVAMEIPGHEIPADGYGDLFDEYMEMKFEDLEVHLAELSAKMSRRARELAGFHQYQQTRKFNDCNEDDGN